MLRLLNTLTRCPGCDRGPLRPVDNGRTVNLFCRSCGACWHLDASGPKAVDPLTCPGCDNRRACLQARRRS